MVIFRTLLPESVHGLAVPVKAVDALMPTLTGLMVAS